MTLPVLSSLFANERINVYLGEEDYSIVTNEGGITDVGVGADDNPTVNVYSDMATVERILTGELGFEEALADGTLRYEGVGFVNSVKVGVF